MRGIYTTIGALAVILPLHVYAQFEDSQYLVYLVSDDPLVIQQAKTIAPDAFTGTLDSGRRVLQLGRYNNLNLAQKRSDELKALGLPVDIVRVSSRSLPMQSNNDIPAPGNFNPPPSTVVSTIPIQPATPTLPGVPGDTTAIEITRPASPPVENLPQTNQTNPPSPPSSLAQEVQAFLQRNRYFVIIPTTSEEVLAKVREIAPTAKFAATERGAFIEIKGYPDRGSAESLNREFRNRGFDSRVIFL